MIGKTLGHYQITEKLGEGGMGVVYRARDPRLGRDVAIKVLPGEVAGSPERLQRFEREARAVAALNHPNILTVFDVGMHDGAPYVVTELLEGETLRAFVSRHSPTPRQILSFARPGGARPGGGPRQGDHPPRHQAGEPVRHHGRAGEDSRLRPRQAHGCAGTRGWRGDGVRSDGSGAAARDAGLHVAGAGARPAAGRA